MFDVPLLLLPSSSRAGIVQVGLMLFVKAKSCGSSGIESFTMVIELTLCV